jgi:hypothetical protein
MKKLCVLALLALAVAGTARAQEPSGPFSQAKLSVAADTETMTAAAEPAAEALPAKAAPEPLPAAPRPRFVFGSRDDFRWQLALGVALVRFRSPFYYATAVGVNTSLTYFTNEWFAVEGSLTTAFAPRIYVNEHVKYAGYGAGPKIAWRGKKWEPWAHAIVGGLHIVPKTANNSESGFELQIGGGADYRIFPHLSARVELDWLKTHVFGAWENSGQANADIVFHF